MNYANVHVQAVAENIVFHCPHDDGTASYRLTPDVGDITVYLGGTPAELKRFAYALLARVRDQVSA